MLVASAAEISENVRMSSVGTRYVVHPNPVKIPRQRIDPGPPPRMVTVEEDFHFVDFFVSLVDADKRITARRENGRIADRVVRQVKKSKPGEVLAFHEADWNLIRQIFDEPSDGFNSTLARHVHWWQTGLVKASEKESEPTVCDPPEDGEPPAVATAVEKKSQNGARKARSAAAS